MKPAWRVGYPVPDLPHHEGHVTEEGALFGNPRDVVGVEDPDERIGHEVFCRRIGPGAPQGDPVQSLTHRRLLELDEDS